MSFVAWPQGGDVKIAPFTFWAMELVIAIPRCNLYIDDQNVYHGLMENRFYGKQRNPTKYDSRYLNFTKLANYLVRDKHLNAIKYFAAKYPAALDQHKHYKDSSFFQRLKGSGITVIEGQFKYDELEKVAREKGVDVRLAIEILTDAFYNNFDHAYVFSNDSDIVPAISRVKSLFSGKKIFSVFFFQAQFDYQKICDGHVRLHERTIKKFYEPEKAQATSDMLHNLKDKINKGRH